MAAAAGTLLRWEVSARQQSGLVQVAKNARSRWGWSAKLLDTCMGTVTLQALSDTQPSTNTTSYRRYSLLLRIKYGAMQAVYGIKSLVHHATTHVQRWH